MSKCRSAIEYNVKFGFGSNYKKKVVSKTVSQIIKNGNKKTASTAPVECVVKEKSNESLKTIPEGFDGKISLTKISETKSYS